MVHGVPASLTGVVFLWRRCATGAWCSSVGVPLHEDGEAPGFYWPESWSSGWRCTTAWLRKPTTDSLWTCQSVFHHQTGNNQTTEAADFSTSWKREIIFPVKPVEKHSYSLLHLEAKTENLPSLLASLASLAPLLDRGRSRGRGSSKTLPPESSSTPQNKTFLD